MKTKKTYFEGMAVINIMRQILLLLLLLGNAACEEEFPPEEETSNVPEVTDSEGNSLLGIDYFVAPWGDDRNNGTFDYPFATWGKAFEIALSGDSIMIRGGEYKTAKTVLLSGRKGTEKNRIVIQNYPGEEPVLNCENIPANGNNMGLIITATSYTTIKGLTIHGVKQSAAGGTSIGVLINSCDNLIVEGLVTHSNGGSGMYMEENRNLLVRNCDSYDNYDPYTSGYAGGNADGFGTVGSNRNIYTRLVGCRAWNNSDDGFDCYNNEGIVVIDSCWAFANGYHNGDGNGFKLGQTKMQALSEVQRIVRNCVSSGNRSFGFNENNANVKMQFYNNTAYRNQYGYMNFSVDGYKEDVIYRNNLAFENEYGAVYFRSEVVQDHNNWNLENLNSIDNKEFQSIEESQLQEDREEDGTLPAVTFLVPQVSSSLNEMGTEVGLPFYGEAAYIGAFEGK